MLEVIYWDLQNTSIGSWLLNHCWGNVVWHYWTRISTLHSSVSMTGPTGHVFNGCRRPCGFYWPHFELELKVLLMAHKAMHNWPRNLVIPMVCWNISRIQDPELFQNKEFCLTNISGACVSTHRDWASCFCLWIWTFLEEEQLQFISGLHWNPTAWCIQCNLPIQTAQKDWPCAARLKCAYRKWSHLFCYCLVAINQKQLMFYILTGLL